MRQTKRLIDPKRVKADTILNLSRKDIKTYIEVIMTGHCKLNYHLKKLGLVDNDSCILCQEDSETPCGNETQEKVPR